MSGQIDVSSADHHDMHTTLHTLSNAAFISAAFALALPSCLSKLFFWLAASTTDCRAWQRQR
jgi:hypothetical protein